jgi:hypothetical protein
MATEGALAAAASEGFASGLVAEQVANLGIPPATAPSDEDEAEAWRQAYEAGKDAARAYAGSASARV